MNEKKEDNIMLWNLTIPITPEIKKTIEIQLRQAVREILKEKDTLLKAVRMGLASHPSYYRKMFTDLIKEIIEENMKLRFIDD